MSEFALVCDQAIFTSVRSPTGEGYRIIAASKGLKPEERQAITRFSPSHEGLCPGLLDADSAQCVTPAVCFYELPKGRLCVSISTTAGAEHTGRGGQRVYTHVAVFDAKVFPQLGFNPFAVARAMIAAGLATPELKPPQVLPELTLTVGETAPPRGIRFASAVTSACRKHVLSCMLSSRSVVLDVSESWLETAELMLLGVPGPMRCKTSVATGLKFSAGRCQRLNVTQDDKNLARNRNAGQPIEFVEADHAAAADASGAWIAFVEKHWGKSEFSSVARRTSCAFADTSPAARERLGKLYALMDDVVAIETPRLLASASEYLQHVGESKDADIISEFLSAAGRELENRLRRQPWRESKSQWIPLLTLWRRDTTARKFVTPIVHSMLRAASGLDMLDACETANDWERSARGEGKFEAADGAAIDDLLSRCAAWADVASELDPQRLRRLCNLLAPVRANCPMVDRMKRRCDTLMADAMPIRG